MDDVNTDTLTTPSAETPGDKASDAPELELELEEPAAGDGQAEGADDELEDWEDEGKTYKVPKALKPRLMKDADYSRKTMELAEQRKTDEVARTEFAAEQKFHREYIADLADVRVLDKQLTAFRAITPEQWGAMDRDKAADLRLKFDLLKDQHQTAMGAIRQKEREALEKQRTTTAKQFEASQTQIAKEIPGWSDELAGKLNGYAMGKGYTEQQLRDMLLRPHDVGTLHKAYLYDQLVAKSRARAKASNAEPEPTPVPKVGARRNPPSSEPLDSDPPDVWRRKRERQLAAQ